MQHNLPQYRCHKVVGAARITELRGTLCSVVTQEEPCLMRTIELDDEAAERIRLGIEAHKSGFLVEYEDGYVSFSPAKAFLEGYAPSGQRTEIEHVANELAHELRYCRGRLRELEGQNRLIEILGAIVPRQGQAMTEDPLWRLEQLLKK